MQPGRGSAAGIFLHNTLPVEFGMPGRFDGWGATSERVATECAAEAAINLEEINKVDTEANLPKSVEEVADVSLPTGGGER